MPLVYVARPFEFVVHALPQAVQTKLNARPPHRIYYFVVTQEYATERVKLEAMRDKMVVDMEKKGINPKVRALAQDRTVFMQPCPVYVSDRHTTYQYTVPF